MEEFISYTMPRHIICPTTVTIQKYHIS